MQKYMFHVHCLRMEAKVETHLHCVLSRSSKPSQHFSAFIYLCPLGWIVYGTFALSKQPDCINALVYLALMYFYMIVFIGACVVGIIWKIYDTMSGGKQSFRVNLPT